MKRLLSILVLLIATISIHAQGIYIYKTDGTRIRLMNAEVDSIVGFEFDNHEAIDLGLSVKWATCNVGANSPEEYGDYFAWGETEAKESYTQDNYQVGYSTLHTLGIVDNQNNLTADYDAATVNWGNGWRMPTKEEIQELLDNCTYTEAELNNVKGFLFTSLNGNSIFLPYAGCYALSLSRVGVYGYYQSASTASDNDKAAYVLLLDLGWTHVEYSYSRYGGLPIRPVTK